MSVYTIIGIVGIVCGILCALADVPLAYSGEKDQDISKADSSVGNICSWWTKVSEKHFDIAFWLSCIGQPGTYLTMWMLAEIIGRTSPSLSLALKINTFLGAYTGLLFHATACQKPLVYRAIHGKLSDADTEAAVKKLDKYPAVPNMISALTLFLGTTVITAAAILTGALDVPKFFLAFNPIGAIIPLMILKKLGIKIVGPLGAGFTLFSVLLVYASLTM